MAEFVTPDFLSDSSADDIHARMLENLPKNMDRTEGGFLWDMTYAPAQELSETVEFVVVEAIKSMFPIWAEGKMLDYHGKNRGIVRRDATRATGMVTFHGNAGTEIPARTLLYTTSDGEDDETILFETLYEGVIGTNGQIDIEVEAVDAGSLGNVAAGRINRMDITDENILSLQNNAATSGGYDVEDDESYRERLIEYDETQGESFIGSCADYKRWALEVEGVGGASVLPAKDDTGIVRIIITDMNGDLASTELCDDVYNHIMQPNNPEERLAPINALLDVKSYTAMTISISANIETDGVRDVQSIKSDYLDALKEYFMEAKEDEEIKYSKICGLLIGMNGVTDYSNVRVNGGTSNIAIDAEAMPFSDTSSVTLNVAVI